jgi:serine/threonine-protein kinase ATR
MIDGLGITGYEGVYLKVCEITLSVLRTHKETLMSVLETFIHDPLVEWTKSHKSSGVEVQNPHAQVLHNIFQLIFCFVNHAHYE